MMTGAAGEVTAGEVGDELRQEVLRGTCESDMT